MKRHSLIPSLAVLLFLCVISSAAWQWPGSLEDKLENIVMRRQEQRPSTSDSSASTITSAPAIKSGGSTASNGTRTSSHASKTTPIDPRLPPGGIQLITPAATDAAQFYKVGDHWTWVWNYTSLSVTPSYLDIFASCATNSATYTIAMNQTVDPTGAVTFDSGAFAASETIPFVVATYTLYILPADQEITAVPSAGYLGTYDQFQFGVYTKEAYTPLNEFKCASCNSAVSSLERQAFGILLTTSLLTVLSFTWFAAGFGAFS